MQDGEGLVNFAFDPDALRLEAGQSPTLFSFELAKSAILIVFVSYKIPIANLFH